jgi:hypothetical protein
MAVLATSARASIERALWPSLTFAKKINLAASPGINGHKHTGCRTL